MLVIAETSALVEIDVSKSRYHADECGQAHRQIRPNPKVTQVGLISGETLLTLCHFTSHCWLLDSCVYRISAPHRWSSWLVSKFHYPASHASVAENATEAVKFFFLQSVNSLGPLKNTYLYLVRVWESGLWLTWLQVTAHQINMLNLESEWPLGSCNNHMWTVTIWHFEAQQNIYITHAKQYTSWNVPNCRIKWI